MIARGTLFAVVATILVLTPAAAVARGAAAPMCAGLPATIVGTAGDDTLTGTARDDVIDAGLGNDRVAGGGGDDVICGDEGNDRLDGGAGADRLDGAAGDDALSGGPSLDILVGGLGDDTLAGGTGRDVADYTNAPAAVTVDLGRGKATGSGTDAITGVETLLGSRFADSLVGDGAPNHLAGQEETIG